MQKEVEKHFTRDKAMKGPDQIRFFNSYYEFVRTLLEEYVAASNGMRPEIAAYRTRPRA